MKINLSFLLFFIFAASPLFAAQINFTDTTDYSSNKSIQVVSKEKENNPDTVA